MHFGNPEKREKEKAISETFSHQTFQALNQKKATKTNPEQTRSPIEDRSFLLVFLNVKMSYPKLPNL